KEISKLENRCNPWNDLQAKIDDILELAKLEDQTLKGDLDKQLEEAEKTLEALKKQLKCSGLYDSNDAILSIHAGAGGTDAQDWTQMVLRMYVRWAENNSYAVSTVDESAGEEAGIKSVTIDVSGDFSYGKLKAEHGVHRLVRLSPFNSDNLRQTSFCK